MDTLVKTLFWFLQLSCSHNSHVRLANCSPFSDYNCQNIETLFYFSLFHDEDIPGKSLFVFPLLVLELANLVWKGIVLCHVLGFEKLFYDIWDCSLSLSRLAVSVNMFCTNCFWSLMSRPGVLANRWNSRRKCNVGWPCDLGSRKSGRSDLWTHPVFVEILRGNVSWCSRLRSAVKEEKKKKDEEITLTGKLQNVLRIFSGRVRRN
jgi:hypothetical protein